MDLKDRIAEEVTKSLQKRNMTTRLDIQMQITKGLFTEVAQEVYLAVYKEAEIKDKSLMKVISDIIRERGYTTQNIYAEATKPESQINVKELRESVQVALDQAIKLRDATQDLCEKLDGLIHKIDSAN